MASIGIKSSPYYDNALPRFKSLGRIEIEE
jgi:hypothetical protein